MNLNLLTIGVYGWEPEQFFAALQAAGIDTFCDIQRPAGRAAASTCSPTVNGSARLAELGIRYLHRPDLAPSAARAPHNIRRMRTHTPRAGSVPNSAPHLSHRTSASG